MTHVITQACCNDASCVSACPVNCIHPTPGEPEFRTAEMLYIDPDTCIDCGACIPECPTDAIVPDRLLTGGARRFLEINAGYYTDHDARGGLMPWLPLTTANRTDRVRVAIVGAGPAGFYAAKRLLNEPNIEVTLIDRLPTPYGLVRGGVAPDHPSTKKVQEVFEEVATSPRVRYLLGVEVGHHLTAAELAEAHHAVLYTHGAAGAKALGIPGEDLPGSVAATEFVGWYNGQPDYAQDRYDLSGQRVVVIGNGNVALDVARVLLADPDAIALTDIAEHALHALRESKVREVVLLARRGPADAAYTIGELAELVDLDGVDVVVEQQDLHPDSEQGSGGRLDSTTAAKMKLLEEATAAEHAAPRRVVLRFHTTPVRLVGDAARGVTAVEVERTAEPHRDASAGGLETIETGLVIRAVGYRGRPLEGVPFDPATGTVPHERGRILDPGSGAPAPGQYVAGWVKRGSRGGIGANRFCAEETALSLIEDLAAGVVPEPRSAALDLAALASQRGATVVDRAGWKRIDAEERAAGAAQGRSRLKLVSADALVATARG